MSDGKVENTKILSLDSLENKLTTLNKSLLEQSIQLNDQLLQSQKVIHQLRINNMYNAHENDLIIDDNIFENDEID